MELKNNENYEVDGNRGSEIGDTNDEKSLKDQDFNQRMSRNENKKRKVK